MSGDYGAYVASQRDNLTAAMSALREENDELRARIEQLETALVEARMGKVDERLGRIRAEAKGRLIHG